MSFYSRKDLGVRVAGDKGQKPDEFLTRMQLQPGVNITFDYETNHDITINALTGGSSSSTVSGVRAITGELELTLRPANTSRGYLYSTPEIVSALDPADQLHYGTAMFKDIVHNWNLKHKDAFSHSLIDIQILPVSGNPGRKKSLPKIIGLDVNTVRIWHPDVGNIGRANDVAGGGWRANANTDVGVETNNNGGLLGEITGVTTSYILPKYRFTIREVL